MAKLLRMDQIRNIIQTYLSCQSYKETARIVKKSKTTIKLYIRRCLKHSENLSDILLLDEEEIQKIVYHPSSNISEERKNIFLGQVSYWLKELRRVGVTKYLLWEEYQLENEDSYSYSQFCELLKREIGSRDLTIALNHLAGEVMQLDFAGKHMKYVDIHTGEIVKCEVLLAVFPHSQYTYAIALPSQKIRDFIHGINQAFVFFGGLPKVILSDNLRSYVTRADNYEPKFTQLCEQLGAHYQIDLQATRVRKPKDKASVERAVSIAYTRVYAPLRNEIFYSIEELNEAIRKQLIIHNAKDYQKKAGSRTSVFQQYELPEMRPLPSELFETKKITKAKVQRNYHVMIGEEKNYYSVHHSHVGKQADILYTTKMVAIYINGQRVAVHDRLFVKGYRYQTDEKHMPKKHESWKEIKGYNAQYFLNTALKIGPSTHWAIQRVLISRIHEQQSYNSCLGILRLAKKYSDQRLENAASRCQNADRVSYSMLKRILEANLDKQANESVQQSLPFHENIRGPLAYQ